MWELTDYTNQELAKMWNSTDGQILDTFDFCPDKEFWLELSFEIKRRGLKVKSLRKVNRTKEDFNPSVRNNDD